MEDLDQTCVYDTHCKAMQSKQKIGLKALYHYLSDAKSLYIICYVYPVMALLKI